MSYFPDLSPYAYGHYPHPGVVHVGWLDGTHPFPLGTVPEAILLKIKRLARAPVELYRGFHVCEICAAARTVDDRALEPYWDGKRFQRSNGEIRVPGDGVIYAAPVGIIHYVEAHGYLPPVEFLKAVEQANEPAEPEKAPTLSEILAERRAKRSGA